MTEGTSLVAHWRHNRTSYKITEQLKYISTGNSTNKATLQVTNNDNRVSPHVKQQTRCLGNAVSSLQFT